MMAAMENRMLRIAAIIVCVPCVLMAQENLRQVKEDFSKDPGWEGSNNRVVCDDCPTIAQDFGWQRDGRIGGTVWRSRTPAYYAMKIGPFSFNDALSASGKLTVMPAERVDGAYFGFFNSARQEWRPWSSLAVRIGDLMSKDRPAARMAVDYMSAG